MNVLNQWDLAANHYQEAQEQSDLVKSNRQVVFNWFSALNGEKVLDLGCGYGFYTNYFSQIGGETVGVDGSAKMLELAQENYPKCRFCHADLEESLPWPDNEYDIVFCNQVLMDLKEAKWVMQECYRVLKPGGIFYYSIVHPAFYEGDWIADSKGFCGAKSVKNYITPHVLKNHFWGETTHFHRHLSFYLNAAAQCGFTLVHTEEPYTYDGVNKSREIPLFFMAEYQK